MILTKYNNIKIQTGLLKKNPVTYKKVDLWNNIFWLGDILGGFLQAY